MTDRSAIPDVPGLAGCAAALVAVCALAWASLATTALPPPAGAGTPPDAFSAARAAVHLRALARSPRPIASGMNEDARRYIVGQLRAMGLQPEVQVATAMRQSMDRFHNVHVTMAVVHNIVARKPGAALGHTARPALLLASHYDSDADTLGASDAASAAAMLETARALQAAAPLANDVVFLFADGDRPGVGPLSSTARWGESFAPNQVRISCIDEIALLRFTLRSLVLNSSALFRSAFALSRHASAVGAGTVMISRRLLHSILCSQQFSSPEVSHSSIARYSNVATCSA